MKAAVIHEFGDADVLKYEEVPTPKPKPGNVVIKVLAAGVNRFDHYLRAGEVTRDLPLPHVFGADASGEIAALGAGTNTFQVGDRVIPVAGFPLAQEDYGIYPASAAPSFTLPGLGIWGSYAQYMEVPARFVLKDDTGLPPEQAATLPMVLATGVRAVKEVGGVQTGNKVLIQSGASGSGSMMIQIAKVLGAQVATTVRSDAKGEFAKSLGADLVINTRDEDFVERVKDWTEGRGADVVLDNLGGDVLPRSIQAARPQGVIVAYGFVAGLDVTLNIYEFFGPQKQLRGSFGADPKDLEWGLEQVRAGRIKAALGRTLPLSEAAEAHRLIAANQVAGKVALLPWAGANAA